MINTRPQPNSSRFQQVSIAAPTLVQFTHPHPHQPLRRLFLPPRRKSLGDSGLHPVMDDKEIAEIRSIGEQYEMEWNDTLNLVNSAWWFKFLKATENGPQDQRGEGFVNGPFDNGNDGCLQHVDDFFSDNYFEDPALPCMDIEEIEGMDGDWLA